jgi:2-succinyl-5-enolpyruvyl-6-hydroxy-3-cyclohexene-1-carboxylate synthase
VLATEELNALAQELRSVERGVIVAGAGHIDPAPPHALAGALGWPLFADPFSGARTPPAISTYDALLRDDAFQDSVAPEIVLRVGAGLLSKPLASWVASAPSQILLDRDGEFLDPARSTLRVLRADPSRTCADLTELLKEQRHAADTDYRSLWEENEKLARATIDEELDVSDEPSEPRTARDVAAAVPKGATLVVASSMPLRDVESFMEPREELRLVANRGANGIDGFVSTALGVALASTGPTVALAGDLSMLHDQNGLLLLRKEPVDVTFVVINNDGGGIFSFLPQARLPEHFETLFGTPQSIDFAALASLYGCHYDLLGAAPELPQLLQASFARGGPHIIEVRTDRDENVALHARIAEAVARSVGRGAR